jgi:hypothetical protein
MLYDRLRSAVSLFAVAAVAGVLTGCSIHPLPEDFSRATTLDIVKSIRCEALEGLQSLKPEERARAVPIINTTTIGLDFTFTMSEGNGLVSPSMQFMRPPSNRFTLDLTGDADVQRQNIRKFHIDEPLADLVKRENIEICKNRVKGPNWTYPIAGKIGLDETVRTYVRLESATKPKRRPDREPFTNFSDDLTFTTNFSASATGHIVLDAVVGRVRLKDANLGVGASRNDMHQVHVSFGRRSEGNGANAAAADERDQLVASGSVRDPRSQARLLQMNAEPRDSIAIEVQQRRASPPGLSVRDCSTS